jgi:hypothetical protein
MRNIFIPFPRNLSWIMPCCLALATVGLSAADAKAKVDATKLPAPAAKTGVTYANDIQPFLEKSCIKCHSGDKPKSKYRINTREGAIKGGSEGEAVKPGKSAESPMVHFASDLVPEMEMPPLEKRKEFPALTKDQIALLRAWIDQGAK